MMKIIDVSHYDEHIDWEKVRTEVGLIIFRSSIDTKNDNKYLEYSQKCGIPYGVYHYLKAATAAQAKVEAEYFYKAATAGGRQPLFFCADIEHTTHTDKNVNSISATFADTLRNFGVKKLGLYIGQSLYPYAAREEYDFIWIPRYGKNTGNADEKYLPIYPCDLWQYTSAGTIAGMDAKTIDVNLIRSEKTLEWFTEGEYQTEKPEPIDNTGKFTNAHFVEFCKKFVGQPYWYGTCVYACTNSLLKSKTAQYSSHYTSDRTSKYNAAINAHNVCADCVGLIKGYAWTNGGEGVIESIGKATPLFTNKYCSNDMPDNSANGMFEYVKKIGLEWGTIDTIPEIPGIAVRYDGHVGVYIGNGEVVEERGFAYGCVKTKLKDRKWLHWYKIPTIIYDANTVAPASQTLKLGDRLLQKGSKGDDVKELQVLLNTYINANLEVDGDFGTKTKNAVMLLQDKLCVTIDGIYGTQTHNNFMLMISDDVFDVTQNKEEQNLPNTTTLITTGAVNCRTGDSTAYSVITIIGANTALEPILDQNNKPLISINGWYAVKCADQIGWVSGKYIQH